MANCRSGIHTIGVRPLGGKGHQKTTILEGSEVSNGVAYEFNLLQKGWFGSYECRVHRSLLDIPEKIIKTKEFEVYGHRWSVRIEHKIDGYLAVHLHSNNAPTVNLIFSIAVLDQSSSCKRHQFQGDSRSFKPNEDCGFSRLVPISEIKDPEAGFLLGDSFVVRIDLRFVLPENDEHTFFADACSGNFTWRLKDLMGMSPLKLSSPEFTFADHKWRMVICPYGDKPGDSRFSARLWCTSDLTLAARVKFRITVPNHYSDQKTISEEMIHLFQQNWEACGWSKFMEIKSLKDEKLGFIKNGWSTFIVHLEVLENEQERSINNRYLLQSIRSRMKTWIALTGLTKTRHREPCMKECSPTSLGAS